MAGKETINAVVLVLALILLLGHVPAHAAASGIGNGNYPGTDYPGTEGLRAGNGNYPEGCIRKEPCPTDAGAECKMYKIPVLPCSCSEIKRCDPLHASGCMETTIAGPRSCGF